MAYRRRRKSTTGYAKATYSEIYDLSTQQGEQSILKFHTPLDNRHRILLGGFFTQFKHYMYTGSKITMAPVATLPADPLMVSFEAGEPTIDPRDLINPILHKPYHGERLVTDQFRERTPTLEPNTQLGAIDQMRDSSVVEIGNQPGVGPDNFLMTRMYYAGLTDPSFRKAHVQQGFRAWGRPLARKVVANGQIDSYIQYQLNEGPREQARVAPWQSSANINTRNVGSMGYPMIRAANSSIAADAGTNTDALNRSNDLTWPNIEFRTAGFTRLGWMDTSGRAIARLVGEMNTIGNQNTADRDFRQSMGKFYSYLAILPPAYKQEMYFRLVIKHYFKFKTFRGNGWGIDAPREQWDRQYPFGDMIQQGSIPVSPEGAGISINSVFVDEDIITDEPDGEPITGNEVGSVETTGGTITRVAEGVGS